MRLRPSKTRSSLVALVNGFANHLRVAYNTNHSGCGVLVSTGEPLFFVTKGHSVSPTDGQQHSNTCGTTDHLMSHRTVSSEMSTRHSACGMVKQT